MRLTQREQRLLRDDAWKKVRAQGETNIVAIGFGTALKDDLFDLTRPSSLRFYVKRKSNRRHKYEIPSEWNVRIGHETRPARKRGRTRSLRVPTDVYELPPLIGVGRHTLIAGNGTVTSGLVVRWKEMSWNETTPTSTTIRWGVVTVAHEFLAEPIGKPVVIEGPAALHSISGQRILQSSPSTEGVDLCLVELDIEDCLRSGILHNPLASAIAFKTLGDLADDQNKLGVSHQPSRTVSYSVVGTLDSAAIDYVGPQIVDLLHVQGGHLAFVAGTSGSILGVFEIEGKSVQLLPAAIQVGADIATYSLALGQSIETALAWLRSQLALKLYRSGHYLVHGEVEPIGVF